MKPKAPLHPTFDSEPPTRQKNATASVYQSLLSVFDGMTAEQRMEFVEFAARYAELDGPTRHALSELLPAYAALDEGERASVDHFAIDLASARLPSR